MFLQLCCFNRLKFELVIKKKTTDLSLSSTQYMKHRHINNEWFSLILGIDGSLVLYP